MSDRTIAPVSETTVTRPHSDTDRLYESIRPLPSATGGVPFLILLSGLPGSGKSYFCRELSRVLPCLVTLETDALRGVLVDTPTHSGEENARLFRAVHRLLQQLLQSGHTVALDATNLIRRNRRRIYRIAEAAGAQMIIVELIASETVIRTRLAQREADLAASRATKDNSTAGHDVYTRMTQTAQPIRREHITIDTSQDIQTAIRQIAAYAQPGRISTLPNPL